MKSFRTHELGPLEDLPGEALRDDEDSVQTTYVEELKAVRAPSELLDFVTRWRVIWEILLPPVTGLERFLTWTASVLRRCGLSGLAEAVSRNEPERSIIATTFDPVQTLKCIDSLRVSGSCDHDKRRKYCTGSIILVPNLLLEARLVSMRYGVPGNTALIQLCRAREGL